MPGDGAGEMRRPRRRPRRRTAHPAGGGNADPPGLRMAGAGTRRRGGHKALAPLRSRQSKNLSHVFHGADFTPKRSLGVNTTVLTVALFFGRDSGVKGFRRDSPRWQPDALDCNRNLNPFAPQKKCPSRARARKYDIVSYLKPRISKKY